MGHIDQFHNYYRLLIGWGVTVKTSSMNGTLPRTSPAEPCLDAPQKLEFFHSLSITSIFRPIHEVVNIGKKITNYTV
jgi:hypothetical protein